MLVNKKQLLADYEEKKQDVFLKVLYQHGKSFLKGDTLALFLILILIQQYFQFSIDKNIFMLTNLFFVIIIIAASLLFFKKERKTSLGSQVLASLVIPYYLFGGNANPVNAIILLLFFICYYKLSEKYKILIADKNRKIITNITLGILIIGWFSTSIFLLKITKKYVNNSIMAYYFIFQLVAWYALFKNLFYYRNEIKKRYKTILEES